MAYYPSELAMLEPALIVDEDLEDMVRVRMDSQGDSEINLYSQYTAEPHHPNPDYNRVESFEDYMSHEPAKRAIPMPMPGYVDPPLTEPDYLDTPYQLKTLGPSLSSYSEQEYEDNCLHPPEGVNPPPNSSSTEEIEVKQSDSSESQAYYGTENVVRELRMEYVRWFYKNDGDRKWTAFTGYDSMRIEARHRELCLRDEEETSQEDSNPTSGGLDMENSFGPQERRYLVNSSGYLYQATSSSIPADGASGLEGGQQQQSASSSVSTRTKRAYKSFTRKWKEWSASAGAGQGNAASPKHTNNNEAGAGAAGAGANLPSCQRARAQWPPVPPPSNPDNIIIVRGGLYEVDLEHNVCYATYWPDLCSITRGIWFYDGVWQPIDWTQADKLEIEHLEKFGGASLITSTMESLPDSPTKKNKQVVHRVSFSDFHVDWSSATEIHLYSKAVPHKLMRSVGQRFGFQTGGHRICRGYFKQCMLSDRPAEINHIVFVVHGIGQKMDTGRIVRNCAAFRECVTTLKKQFYPHSELSRQKAEFFPVEWRSAAKLDGDIVDAITPHKLLGLRQMLNATAMDIMYYTSPLYRTEIQNALRSELNRIYSNFVKRNPNFEARGGKVSVLAHSLGAVITYDIMTGYISPLRSDCPELRSIELNGVDQSEEINHEGILVIDDITSDEMPEQPRLLFKLEHFFCLGSPLAVFLALRWKEPHNPDLRSYILPPTLCKRVYNVFHPSDPVAYRLEPLLSKSYVKIAPLVIHPTGSSTKPKYDEMEKELISREPTTQQQPHASAKADDIFGGNYGPTGQSNSCRSTPQRFNATNANVTSGPPSSSLSMAANLKSPPTPSKDSNWSWFNLMKYWKTPESNPEFSQTSSMGSPPGFQELGHQVIPGRSPRIPDVDAEVQFHSLPPGPRNDEFVPDTSMGEETFMTATAASVPPIPNDLEYRMDYVLRESNLSSSYLAALTSHTAYWNTPDVAFFVLTHLYNGSLEQVDNH